MGRQKNQTFPAQMALGKDKLSGARTRTGEPLRTP
jgi:hypothetical protein